MKSYAVQSGLMRALSNIVGPTVMLGIGMVWIRRWLRQDDPYAPAGWMWGVWLLALGSGWYQSLRMPYRIDVRDDGQLEFVAPLRRVTISPQDVVSVRAKALRAQVLELRHAGGKLTFYRQFAGLQDFLSQLKRLNPGIEFIGC